MSIELDRRTCRDDDIELVTPHEFFAVRFPSMAGEHGHLVAQAISQLGTRALTIEVDRDVWSILSEGDHEGGGIVARRGAVPGAMVLTMTQKEFSDWCQNQRSLNSFSVARTLKMRDGDARDVSIWDSLLHSLLYGWPTVGQPELVDRNGDALDLDRCFTPEDDPLEIAHFLREAGFLHLRGWTDTTLMPMISADMDRVLPTYVEGDGKSWWAQLGDGTRVCVRLQEFVEHSPATVALLTSERWEQLRRAIAQQDPLEQGPVEGRCIEALIKPVGVVSGPSDLSFHRDCHLGRHAYACSSVTIGVSLTASTADNGQLRVIPGSHRVAMPVEIARHEPFIAPHALTTEVGDLTVHLSCTLHEATAPIAAERRVMYTGFSLVAKQTSRPDAADDLNELREQVTNILRDNPT